jgi:16S rRNA (adenine1518-N6/adenine1519-N6)-dimethyltransferase
MTYNPFSVQFLKCALRGKNLFLSRWRGQNYLIDKNIAFKIASYIPANSIVFEAGSGMGALTHIIADKFKVFSIEIDRGIYDLLMVNLEKPSLTLINADFLKFDISGITAPELFFVSNTPYSIAGEIIKKFINCKKFRQGIVMLQDEMLQRMLAPVSNYSYSPFTVLCSHYLEIKKLFSVGRNSFFPVPSVDSAVIFMKKKDSGIPQKEFNSFLRESFLSRRKTLLNNLKKLGFSAKNIEKKGINPLLRPQDIDTEGWVMLFKEYMNITGNKSAKDRHSAVKGQ